jgi:hypothetical protein
MTDATALALSDRVACAAEQMAMTMRSGVMTTRRLNEVAAEWADGDGGDVIAEVWSVLVSVTDVR